MIRLLWLFVALAFLVLIPFLIWGEGLERTLQPRRRGRLARRLRRVGLGCRHAAAGLGPAAADPGDRRHGGSGLRLRAALGRPDRHRQVGFLGGTLGYGLCRGFGRPLARRLLGPRDLEQGERLFARTGGWLVVLSRWLPIFPEVIACMAGLARMPLRTFLTHSCAAARRSASPSPPSAMPASSIPCSRSRSARSHRPFSGSSCSPTSGRGRAGPHSIAEADRHGQETHAQAVRPGRADGARRRGDRGRSLSAPRHHRSATGPGCGRSRRCAPTASRSTSPTFAATARPRRSRPTPRSSSAI